MAIERTPMCDDDGSERTGTVINNDWKQELYNQIDAADAQASAQSPWYPMFGGMGDWHIDSASGLYISNITILLNQYRWIGSDTICWQLAANPIHLPQTSPVIAIANLPWRAPTGGVGLPCAYASNPVNVAFDQYDMEAGYGYRGVAFYRVDGAAWNLGPHWFYLSVTFRAEYAG